MAKTFKQIATSVLQKLGRLPEGQTATGAQEQKIQDAYDSVYAQLRNDSLVNWTSDEDIPDEAASYVKTLLLAEVADDFGVPDKWSQLTRETKLMLAGQIANPYVPQTTQFEDL